MKIYIAALTLLFSFSIFAQKNSGPAPLEFNEDKEFLEFFKIKGEKEVKALEEYKKTAINEKASIAKKAQSLSEAEKKLVKKIDEDLSILSKGYNSLKMTQLERERALKLLSTVASKQPDKAPSKTKKSTPSKSSKNKNTKRR